MSQLLFWDDGEEIVEIELIDDLSDEDKQGDRVKEGENESEDGSGGVQGGGDATDSISSHHANLMATTDDEKEPGEDGQQAMKDEEDESKLLELDEDGTNENGDDTNLDICKEVSMVKVEDLYKGGVDEQKSNASIDESSIIIATASPEDKQGTLFGQLGNILQNGVEANTNENSSSSSSGENNKPLLSGLLGRKDDSRSSLQKKSGQPSRSFSISDGNAIAKELEEQVVKLNELLVLKEKEWSAILRLKKHMEYALDQVKCTQRIAKVQDGMKGPMSTTDIKACMNLIMSEKDTFRLAKRQIEESIESTETENESLQTIFPLKSPSRALSTVQNGLANRRKEDELNAATTLLKLGERKETTNIYLPPNRVSQPRIVDFQSNSNSSKQRQRKSYKRKAILVKVPAINQTRSRNKTGNEMIMSPPQPVVRSDTLLNLTPSPGRRLISTLTTSNGNSTGSQRSGPRWAWQMDPALASSAEEKRKIKQAIRCRVYRERQKRRLRKLHDKVYKLKNKCNS